MVHRGVRVSVRGLGEVGVLEGIVGIGVRGSKEGRGFRTGLYSRLLYFR